MSNGQAANALARTPTENGSFAVTDFVVRRANSLIEAEVDGELIGLEVEQGQCYGFNATATRVWALIEEPMRFTELRDRLRAEYDVDEETCARDLRALLEELAADRLVTLEPLEG
jgi:hypothetical protein